jgi:PAT family beta-lactamase induction signal transducer AmpG
MASQKHDHGSMDSSIVVSSERRKGAVDVTTQGEKKGRSPFLWIPCLFAAEEIPTAMVTFVALLMFIQFCAGTTRSTIFVSILLSPWMLKSFFRLKVKHAGNFKMWIHIIEFLIFVILLLTAFYINDFHANYVGLLCCMFVISLLCSWHNLVARMYYEKVLSPREQRIYRPTKHISTQASAVMTYGVLMIVVGFLEIFFRDIHRAWAMENYLVAGVFFIFFCLNLVFLPSSNAWHPYHHASLSHTIRKEMDSIERLRSKPHAFRVLLFLFFLLLPQSLMFCPRVFFLLAPHDGGGLSCSLQDIGFAQGTIGIIAFTAGAFLARHLERKYRLYRILSLLAVVLTLSPLCYVYMSFFPPVGNLLIISICSFIAQFCFGFGLHGCIFFVRFFSNDRYRNTTNLLYLPLIIGEMLLPIALSGWLSQHLGFELYFIIDAATALIAWGVILIKNEKLRMNN